MLRINEQHTTIGVQGWTKVDGNWRCIESFTERKFGNYNITVLRARMILLNPKVQYIKIYMKNPICVPFLKWYDNKGNEVEHPLMDD
jgi:hypothetical protein